MAVAQFIVESTGLLYKIELACAANGCPGSYKNAECDRDNKHYFGRGYGLISNCTNYREASKFIHKDDRYVEDPDMVAENEEDAFNTAFWLWRVHTF